MLLFVARHAWAGEFGDPNYPDDSKRPLTREGVERYQQMLEELASRGFAPRRIATSPFVRCMQTAELISRVTEPRALPVALDALTQGSNLERLIEWSREYQGEDICWVGHMPDVAIMTAALIGSDDAMIRFAKGGIAAIEFEATPGIGRGQLNWLVTAKVLGV